MSKNRRALVWNNKANGNVKWLCEFPILHRARHLDDDTWKRHLWARSRLHKEQASSQLTKCTVNCDCGWKRRRSLLRNSIRYFLIAIISSLKFFEWDFQLRISNSIADLFGCEWIWIYIVVRVREHSYRITNYPNSDIHRRNSRLLFACV